MADADDHSTPASVSASASASASASISINASASAVSASVASTPRRSSRRQSQSQSCAGKPMIGQSSTPVLSAEFLNRHSSKIDLVERLSKVIEQLKDDLGNDGGGGGGKGNSGSGGTSSQSGNHETDCIPEPEENIVDVWTIIFELHKVPPQILTTVIGTFATSLTDHDTEEKRRRVANLLGQLFCSSVTDIAVSFHPCYRDWLKSCFDESINIRRDMVGYLIAILEEKPAAMNICQEATKALASMTMTDKSLEIRSLCIHKICDFVHRHGGGEDGSRVGDSSMKYSAAFVAPDLLYAVGDRVKSETEKERLEAITGLANIYNRHYIWPKIDAIQKGGEDCAIDVIVDIMRKNCDFDIYIDIAQDSWNNKCKLSKVVTYGSGMDGPSNPVDKRYKFIPRLVFECLCISDSTDPALRTRIMKIIDDILLGNASFTSKSGERTLHQMTLTSRAVGLTMIVNYLQTLNDKDGCKHELLLCLMETRNELRMALRSYTDARAEADSLPNGSEIITHCVQLAQECFNERHFEVSRAFLESALSALSIFPSLTTEELNEMLAKLHGKCGELCDSELKQINQLGILTSLNRFLATVTLDSDNDRDQTPESLQVLNGDHNKKIDLSREKPVVRSRSPKRKRSTDDQKEKATHIDYVAKNKPSDRPRSA